MDEFIFDKYNFDSKNKELTLSFIIVENGHKKTLTEKILFPKDREIINNPGENLLKSIHIVTGISYWKIFCPKKISFANYQIDKTQSGYFKKNYTKGLGEFFYKNKIDFRGLVNFAYGKEKFQKDPDIKVGKKMLVGVGGGKDSILSIEKLRESKLPFEGFVVETQKNYPLIDEVISTSGIDVLKIKRIIDPQIFDLNQSKNSYNGHVPISAIYAFLGILSSYIYGYSAFLTSNERSANFGNVDYLGEEINHQWSKSYEFEEETREYIHNYVSKNIDYVSLLRPYNEFQIVSEFVDYEKYLDIFSSCNSNFSINKKNNKKWCCKCPKCAFVFLILSVFLPEDRVVKIFGENLLQKEEMMETYKQLLGVKDFKPFECVGDYDEVKYAFSRVYEDGKFINSPIIRMFELEVLPKINDEELEKIVLDFDKSILPKKYQEII